MADEPLPQYKIKPAVRERDDFRCTVCGMTNDEHRRRYGRQLDVHRVTPGSAYAADETCVTVCRACHGKKPGSGRPSKGPRAAIQAKVASALRDMFEHRAHSDGQDLTTAMHFAIVEYLAKRGVEVPQELRNPKMPPQPPTN